jgi:hypothetical protein
MNPDHALGILEILDRMASLQEGFNTDQTLHALRLTAVEKLVLAAGADNAQLAVDNVELRQRVAALEAKLEQLADQEMRNRRAQVRGVGR